MSRCSLPLWRPPQLRPQVWVMQKLAWPTPRPVAVEDGCTCLVSERQGWEAGPRPPIEARNLARPAHHTRDRGGAASPSCRLETQSLFVSMFVCHASTSCQIMVE